VQEGVAFAFKYGMDILSPLGIQPAVIRAGWNNMFLSPLFRETLAGVSGVAIELYRTDGAEGAARGAGIGCGHYSSPREAFAALERREIVEPSSEHRQEYQDLYQDWMASLNRLLS
jgi:xylulokinase